MIRVKLESSAYGTCGISFQHDMEARMTQCWIHVYGMNPTKETPPIYTIEGYAYCHHKDNYSRSRGRKIALARALENHFTKDERKVFWDAYHSVVRRNR